MDCQYLTACTTHLGVSDVVKPESALLFCKEHVFLPPCLSVCTFQEVLYMALHVEQLFILIKDRRAQGTEVPTVIFLPSSPCLFDV